jgi:acyl-CoA reductase-like NAD-dependent aldehyde dehydrogenase
MTVFAMNSKSETTASMVVCNPFDGVSVGEVQASSSGDIEVAVQRAADAAQAFRHSTPAERRALLDALANEVRDDQENLARLICGEMGKTIREARNEARRAVNTLRLSGDAATFLDGEVLHCAVAPGRANRQATVTYVPVGVVGAITPFNYPLNLLCHKLGPAIAAGNAV